MGKVLITEQHLTDIANAIRYKLDTDTKYRPEDMADAIRNMHPVMRLQSKTITGNGTITPDDGYDGLSSVMVDVQGGGGADVLMAKQGDTLYIAIPTYSEYGPMSSAGQYIVPLQPDGVTPAKLNLSQPYEIGCTFKIPSGSGNGLNIWGSSNSYFHCPTISIRSNRFQYNLSTNGSSWAYNTNLSDIAVPTDTYIFAKVSFDGSNTAFFVDTGEKTASITLEGVSNYYNPSYGFEFGGQNKSSYSIAGANATLKMAGTYLKQGDTVIWGGGSPAEGSGNWGLLKMHQLGYYTNEYQGNIYGSSAIAAANLVLLGDFSQTGAASGNMLADAISNYSALLLQGIYNAQRTSGYNTTMMYIDPQLNTAYWAGMKDRNSSYDCRVTFTDDTHCNLSGNRQVIIYGLP